MKIHQLPMGARFEYEGVEYVKSGPLFGNGPQGQRLIPKYAVLKPLGAVAPAAPAAKTAALPRERVLQAFAAFSADCAKWLPAEHAAAWEAARQRFLAALDGGA